MGTRTIPKLLVCTPAYGGLMNFEYVTSLLLLERAAREASIEVHFQFLANESLIQRARNFLCDFFMKSDCTHLMFIDADIQFDPADVLRMMATDVDLIGGVYPKKMLHWERMGTLSTAQLTALQRGDQSPLLDVVNTSILESDVVKQIDRVRWVGTGFMLIKRVVMERMQANNPERTFLANGQRMFTYFDCALWNDTYLSEDYYFCERWRELGGTVHSAPWTKCVHWGTFGFKCT